MKKLFIFLFLFSFFTINTISISKNNMNTAYATDDTDKYKGDARMEDVICNVLGFLTGGVGKALASFACIGVSLAFLGGKLSWTTILTFAVGMACIFGAPQIINAFTGNTTAICSEGTTKPENS